MTEFSKNHPKLATVFAAAVGGYGLMVAAGLVGFAGIDALGGGAANGPPAQAAGAIALGTAGALGAIAGSTWAVYKLNT